MKAKLPQKLIRTLDAVLAVPTAPFCERWLRDHLVARFEKHRSLSCRIDPAGNLLVRYRPTKKTAAKVCFQAHLDHPGFILRSWHNRQGIADAFGGIPENLLGAKLRFFPEPTSRGIVAKITGLGPHPKLKSHGAVRRLQITSSQAIPIGSVGMWNYPHLKIRGSWLDGRAFDDNLGTAILTYIIEEHIRRKTKEPLDFLFTRAEEVGYLGILEVLRGRTFKLPSLTVTIEMPRAAGDLIAGNGVMIRAGDKNFGFDPRATAYIEWIARKIHKKHPGFQYQRRLGLFGGTESGVLQLSGYQASSLCLPVVSAHNISFTNRGKPTTERVHRDDLLALVTLALELGSRPWNVPEASRRIRQSLFKNSDQLRKLLDR